MASVAGAKIASYSIAAITTVPDGSVIDLTLLGVVATAAWRMKGLSDRIENLWCQHNGNKKCLLENAINKVLDEKLGK